MTPDQQTRVKELRIEELRAHRGPHTLFIRNAVMPLIESLVSENAAKDVEIERLRSELSTAKAEGFREGVETCLAEAVQAHHVYEHSKVWPERTKEWASIVKKIRALLPVNSTHVTDKGDTNGLHD